MIVSGVMQTPEDKPITFRELEQELNEWRAERDRLDALISAREASLAALRKEASLGIAPQAKDKPDTGEAVLRVLNGNGHAMTKREIFNELVERGWAPEGKNPEASVASALWYLASKQGLVRKIGSGRSVQWMLAKDSEPVDPTNLARHALVESHEEI